MDLSVGKVEEPAQLEGIVMSRRLRRDETADWVDETGSLDDEAAG